MGWDGKPIPYWLYKLHGLGQVFSALSCIDISQDFSDSCGLMSSMKKICEHTLSTITESSIWTLKVKWY